MVQFTTIAVATLAVLSGTVTAVDCTAGRAYCGWELQNEVDSVKYAGRPIDAINNGLMDRILLASRLPAGSGFRSDYTYRCIADGNLDTPINYCGEGQCEPPNSKFCTGNGDSCCRNGPRPPSSS